MIICNPRSLAFAMLIAALPMGSVFAGGSGGRGAAIGGGVGAIGMGSAAVGGGAPAGAVGGGPPAGAVGGGSPGSNNPGGNGAAGTGNPSLNAVRGGPGGNGTNTPGIPNAHTSGSNIGGYGGPTGVAPASNVPIGGVSPAASSNQPNQGQSTNDHTARTAVQGVAEGSRFSPTGFAVPGPDGVSTEIVAARPCGVAAHETDGTTTCVGIPDKNPNAGRHHHRRATELPSRRFRVGAR
jgi:hypothetical protein